MQVRFLGFSFKVESNTVTLQDYVDHMINNRSSQQKLGDHDRIIFLNDTYSPKYYVGLLVTVKDQKTYCELVENAGKLIVRVNELDDDSKMMDFNFFVINKTNGLGIYQYYHQSCSLGSFGYLNTRLFNKFRDGKIDSEIASNEKLGKTSSANFVKRKYKSNLKWEILVRQEKLKELMEEMARVKAFEYSFQTLTVEEEEFKPQRYIKSKRTRLTFKRDSPVSGVANYISSFVQTNNIGKGKVICEDSEGFDRILRLTDNPDTFAEFDYDDVAPKINSMDIRNFENSWVVDQLLQKCHEFHHIFGGNVK